MNEAAFAPYVTLARKCLGNINYGLGQIEGKIMEALRLTQEAEKTPSDELMLEWCVNISIYLFAQKCYAFGKHIIRTID